MSLPTSPKDVTPGLLTKHPQLISVSKTQPAPPTPLSGIHGLVGAAVMPDASKFVTSPNCDYIPLPPLGNDRHMRPRKDGRYGHDDPTLWPQPFVRELPHLPFVRQKQPVPQADDCLWYPTSIVDFEPQFITCGKGLGTCAKRLLDSIKEQAKTIRSRVLNFEETAKMEQTEYRSNSLLSSYSLALSSNIERLSNTPMTLNALMLTVSNTQRFILEMDAFLRYASTYRPRLTGQAPPAPAVESVMGCFVTDQHDADAMIRAGCPVWLVRPFTEFPNAWIGASADFITPDSTITLADAEPPWPTVYTSSAASFDKYDNVHYHSRCFGAPRNPFHDPVARTTIHPLDRGTPAAQPSTSHAVVPSSTGPTPTVSSRKQNRPSPYTKSRGGKSKAPTCHGRDKFEPIIDEYAPNQIQSWVRGLGSVVREPGMVQEGAQTGSVLPEPALFLTATTQVKRTQYLIRFIVLRGFLLHHASSVLLKNQQWRTLLSMGWAKEGSDPNTQAAKARSQLLTLLKDWENDSGFSLHQNALTSTTAEWRGHTFHEGILPPRRIVQEVLWEIGEVNFRHELVATDARAHLPDIQAATNDRPVFTLGSVDREYDRRQLIAACFPNGKNNSSTLTRPSINDAHRGLVAAAWADRVPYLCSLQLVMSTWHHYPEHLRVDARSLQDETSRNRFELDLTSFYCQTFYRYFGRAAIIPTSLDKPSEWK